jgi:hypothetical protein
MLNIKEIAPKLTQKLSIAITDDEAVEFTEALIAELAKAEQRVAEACALQVATETKLHWLDAARVAKEIRSGEWRKFVKEV